MNYQTKYKIIQDQETAANYHRHAARAFADGLLENAKFFQDMGMSYACSAHIALTAAIYFPNKSY